MFKDKNVQDNCGAIWDYVTKIIRDYPLNSS